MCWCSIFLLHRAYAAYRSLVCTLGRCNPESRWRFLGSCFWRGRHHTCCVTFDDCWHLCAITCFFNVARNSHEKKHCFVFVWPEWLVRDYYTWDRVTYYIKLVCYTRDYIHGISFLYKTGMLSETLCSPSRKCRIPNTKVPRRCPSRNCLRWRDTWKLSCIWSCFFLNP